MKHKRILALIPGIALAICLIYAAADGQEPEPTIEESKTTIETATHEAIEMVDVVTIQVKEPEYIPSTEAEPGYIPELELIEITEEIGNLYDICPELLQAMCETESTYYIQATNGDCKGLMQISEHWHEERMERLGVTDIYEPYSNILLAADYLSELYEEGGQEHETMYVLMRYNMAIDTANELWANGQTTYYARSIVARAAELERLHGK